ncbi:hypothetical protein [Actinokineospora terrae]|uniref:Glycosyltransferase Family 4 n=1 Tax=Actinokineospora terrae TaxID=155974 RepID=A0A1H9XP65_9PSEU|nr:hypothetical protein [Actinokineospora terrae]SES47958.1 hypothetical protein SAMN04487818_11845 [Actinokineospora terrae]
MLALAVDPDYDVVHNNSLHHLPVAMAAALSVPMLTTLHTPPTPWLESAISLGSSGESPPSAPTPPTGGARASRRPR